MSLLRLHIILVLLAPVVCFSQQTQNRPDSALSGNAEAAKKIRFSGSLYSSIPIGKFSSKDVNNPGAGFAGSGAGVRLFAEYNINKRFGVCAAWLFNNFSVNGNAVIGSFQKQYGNSYQFTLASNSWKVSSLMVGIYDVIPIPIKITYKDGTVGKKYNLKFTDRFLVGISNVNMPSFALQGTNGSSLISIDRPGISASSAFSILYGIGLRVDPRTAKHFFIGVNIDYLSTRARIKAAPTTVNNNGTVTTTYADISQSIATITPGFTVGWAF